MANIQKATAVSGDATIVGIAQPSSDEVQVGVNPVSSSGTVTITIQCSGENTFKTLTDGTIDLNAPQTLRFTGGVTAVKATSSGLDYELVVRTR